MIRWIAALLVAVAAVAAIQAAVIHPWQCNIDVKDLRDQTMAVSQNPDASSRAMATRDLLEQVRMRIHHCPPTAELYMIAAADQRILGLNQDAIDTYTAALQVDRRPEIYSNRGDVEAQMGRREEAKRDYILATRFNIRSLVMVQDLSLRAEVFDELARSGNSPFRMMRHGQLEPKPQPEQK